MNNIDHFFEDIPCLLRVACIGPAAADREEHIVPGRPWTKSGRQNGTGAQQQKLLVVATRSNAAVRKQYSPPIRSGPDSHILERLKPHVTVHLNAECKREFRCGRPKRGLLRAVGTSGAKLEPERKSRERRATFRWRLMRSPASQRRCPRRLRRLRREHHVRHREEALSTNGNCCPISLTPEWMSSPTGTHGSLDNGKRRP